MATKRDYSYYLDRLEREHPAIYADYKAGRFPSPRSALVAAELIRPPSPLTLLQRAWRKASPSERSVFMAWATGSKRPAGRRSSSRKAITPVVDAEGRLVPVARTRIKAVMEARKIKMGIVMAEMGFIPQNQSVSGALHQDNRICDSSLVEELERWLEVNKAHW